MKDWGIGIVGLGGIALLHHLAGYRRHGLRVVGGADINPEQRRAAAEAGVEWTVEDYRALIDHPDVKVIDLAVPHRLEIRLPIVEYAAQAGKPILIQKPLASRLDEAKRLVEAAKAHGALMMVNQNSVFVPAFQALEPYLRDGAIGEPYYCQIENRGWFDPSDHPWFGKSERWIISDMAIHHLALTRHWFGDAETVSAVCARDPSQSGVVGENLAVLLITFKSGVKATVINNWCYRGSRPRQHGGEEIVIQGDRGSITATSREVTVSSYGERPAAVHPRFEGDWFPDAFGRAMRHFIQALKSGAPFLCEAEDNLKTLAIAEAAYRSIETGSVVSVDAVLAEAGIAP